MAITGADIKVRFGSEGAGKVTGDINRLGGAVDDANSKGQGFLGTMTKVAGGFLIANVITAGAGAVIGFGKSLINSSAAMETYKNQLVVATGSQEKANKVFNETLKMAKQTPFEFPELVEGAANLEALGQSSEKWLPVIADTASGVNKSINQTVQAVLDAQTGEFERLKEFGIRTKVEGDKVKFSFMQNGKEMVVEAENTQKGISEALLGIWDNKYDGAMEQFAQTFTGRMSTLTDNIRIRAQQVFAPIFDQLSAGTQRLNEFFDQWEEEGFGAAFRDLAIDLGEVAVNVGDWIAGVIPSIADWLVDTALPAGGAALGTVAVNVGQWAVGVIPNIWDWLKQTIGGWLGLGGGSGDGTGGANAGNLIDTLAVSVGTVDFPDLGTKLIDGAKNKLTEWAGGGNEDGTGGIPLDKLDVDVASVDFPGIAEKFMAGAREKITGVASDTEGTPIDAGTVHAEADVDVDISFADIYTAFYEKVNEAFTVTPEEKARWEPTGRKIGANIMGGLLDGIASVFGGSGGAGAGGGVLSTVMGVVDGSLVGNFLWSYLSPGLEGAWDEIKSRLEVWGAGLRENFQGWWNGFAPSFLEFGQVSPLAVGGTVSAAGALKDMLGIEDPTFFDSLRESIEGSWNDFTGWLDDFDFSVSLPSIDIDWPDPPDPPGWMTEGPQWWKNMQAGRMPWDDGGGGGDAGSGIAANLGHGIQTALDSALFDLHRQIRARNSSGGGGRTARGDSLGIFSGLIPGADVVGQAVSRAISGVPGVISAALANVRGADVTVTITAETGGAVAGMGAVTSLLAGLDGASATTYQLGDNAGALAAVDAAAVAVGGIDGMTALTLVNGDNSNALGAVLGAASAMAGFDGTVATGYLEAVNNVGGAVADAINALQSLDGRTATAYVNVVSRGAGVGSSVPGFADGGYVRSPLALVGERGPELVSLPPGSYVHTAQKTQSMLAGGGPSLTVDLSGSTFHNTSRAEMEAWARDDLLPLIASEIDRNRVATGVR